MQINYSKTLKSKKYIRHKEMFSHAIDFNSALFQARNFKFAERFREVVNVSTFRRKTITNRRLEFSEKIIEKVKKVWKSSRIVRNHSYIRMLKCVLVYCLLYYYITVYYTTTLTLVYCSRSTLVILAALLAHTPASSSQRFASSSPNFMSTNQD